MAARLLNRQWPNRLVTPRFALPSVSTDAYPRADRQEPTTAQLRGVVNSPMWRWLFEAYRLLGIHVEIVDQQVDLVTPSSSASAALRSAVAANRGDAQFLTREGPVAALRGMRGSCTPIVVDRTVVGAVLVAADESSAVEDPQLARVGAALTKAVAGQLSNATPDRGDGLHRISALYQLLHAGVAIGSETAVLHTFAEALSIWEDIEVFVYRAGLDGRYRLEVTLPGSDVSAVPQILDDLVDPDRPAVSRLSADKTARVHVRVGRDERPAHLVTTGGSWLIAMRSTRNAADTNLSELYFAALAHALHAAVTVEASRLTWTVMQQFVGDGSSSQAAARAVAEVSSVLQADGQFVVIDRDGGTFMAAGTPATSTPERSAIVDGATLRASIDAPAPFTATLEMRAAPGRVFTARDVMLFESVRDTFDMWLPTVLRQAPAGRERRGRVDSFDDVIDRYARDAYAAGDAASFILIGGRDASIAPQVMQRWIKRLRPELRPTDLAGRLRTGEIGILLLQTPSDGAQVAAQRLARLFDATTTADEPAVRVGVASQFDTVITAAALIAHARRQTVGDATFSG
ncbi:MAG: hypothetical protein JWL71_4350 [Acidobacteria bacterium]|nr:hypothetical protein [Acidobacteriota bacterium]